MTRSAARAAVQGRKDNAGKTAGMERAQAATWLLTRALRDKERQVPDREVPVFGPNPDARMTVSSAGGGIDWAAYPDHSPDYLAGRITLAEARDIAH